MDPVRDYCLLKEMKTIVGGTPGVSGFYREGDGVVVEHGASAVMIEQLRKIFRGLPSFYENHFVPAVLENPGRQN